MLRDPSSVRCTLPSELTVSALQVSGFNVSFTNKKASKVSSAQYSRGNID